MDAHGASPTHRVECMPDITHARAGLKGEDSEVRSSAPPRGSSSPSGQAAAVAVLVKWHHAPAKRDG